MPTDTSPRRRRRILARGRRAADLKHANRSVSIIDRMMVDADAIIERLRAVGECERPAETLQ